MSKTKIFYVEDELFLGKIVRESLESRGFDVVMESDGAKATGAFKKSEPDICVLDVMLPNRCNCFVLKLRIGKTSRAEQKSKYSSRAD